MVKNKIEENVILAKYSTLNVGGKARFFSIVDNQNELIKCVNFAKEKDLPVVLIGGGNNILISDNGFDGLVIVDRMKGYKISGSTLFGESGCNFSSLCRETFDKGLVGLEFGAGIPGSVGGAINGNVGALGGQIADVLVSVKVLNDGKIVELKRDELNMDYRDSKFKGRNEAIILSAVFELGNGSKEDIEAKRGVIEEDKARRARNYVGRTAGSYFKNPPGDKAAGKLIEEAGLKGYKIGGAEVSEMHGNVFRNAGKATAADFYELEKYVVEKVKATSGITLEPEVVKIGKF